MAKVLQSLTETQRKFIDYLTTSLEKDNRIIFYKSNGYFGLEYAINLFFNKIEVLRFHELKKRRGKNILFRIAHIFSATITAAFYFINKVNISGNISNILDNLENIYLGVNKEQDFLKFLKVRKYPHKYKKPKWIIRITDDDIQSSDDVASLRLLCTMVCNKKIDKTVLLISGEKIEMLNLIDLQTQEPPPHFELSFEDIKLLAKFYKLQISENIEEDIEIIRKCGLQFFLDNYKHFNFLSKASIDVPDWNKKINLLIDTLIHEKNIDHTSAKQIYQLLEFASFFEDSFTKLSIANFKENQLDVEYLSQACDLAIIRQIQEQYPTYYFEIDAFKMYFNYKYHNDLVPLPKQLYKYFQENYPFEYLAALKILNIDTSIESYETLQSLIIIAYYHDNVTKGFVAYARNEYYMRYANKDSVALYIIELYDEFKFRKNQKFDNQHLSLLLSKLEHLELSSIAFCALYCLILQILKENFSMFETFNFSAILAELKSHLLCINDESLYNLYWQNHFKCQYVALSMEDEKTNMVFSRRILEDIKKISAKDTLKQYIKLNNLRGFERIELLSYSLGMNHSEKILRDLYNNSEDSTKIKELARINYSAYLIENLQYELAEKILKKAHFEIISSINIDTSCAYYNNLYSAQMGANMITKEKYIECMEELAKKNISMNDKLIIKNNLFTICLFCKEYVQVGEQGLIDSIKNGNTYNKFIAQHNLLYFYFSQKDKLKFELVYKQIKIPKLLKSDTSMFMEKFKWMLEHIKSDTEDPKSPFLSTSGSIFCNKIIIGSIERWFE